MAGATQDQARGTTTVRTALIAEPAFNVVEALDSGVLGKSETLATSSGVENVSCCHSLIATG